jgi:hypothetical protein
MLGCTQAICLNVLTTLNMFLTILQSKYVGCPISAAFHLLPPPRPCPPVWQWQLPRGGELRWGEGGGATWAIKVIRGGGRGSLSRESWERWNLLTFHTHLRMLSTAFSNQFSLLLKREREKKKHNRFHLMTSSDEGKVRQKRNVVWQWWSSLHVKALCLQAWIGLN